MMAEMPGPTFWHLDGSGMDDKFAFDIHCKAPEEWEQERSRWDDYNRRFNAESSERKSLGIPDHSLTEEGSGAGWSRSFSMGETTGLPLGVRVFGIGCRLAEIIVDLRGGGDREAMNSRAQRLIDQLDRDFGNLREILQGSDASVAGALVDPVIQRFTDSLDTVATAHPDLAAHCEALQKALHELLDPPAPEPTWDSNDSELPF